MNQIGRWLAKAALACCLVSGFTQAAGAQTMWKFEGLQFPARDGWCSKETNQGTAAEPAATLEARRCGDDFPYMSFGVAQPGAGGGPRDIPPLVENGVEYASGPDGHKFMLDSANREHSSCAETSYEVKQDAVVGVAGFAVEAAFKCSDLSEPVTFRNWTTFASTRSGELWIVAFDYPTAPVTGGDIAMIQSAIATIQAKP